MTNPSPNDAGVWPLRGRPDFLETDHSELTGNEEEVRASDSGDRSLPAAEPESAVRIERSFRDLLQEVRAIPGGDRSCPAGPSRGRPGEGSCPS
jgi:hypothetical protein